MAEQADAADLKSAGREVVRVRFPSAPQKIKTLMPIFKYAHICEYARAESSGTVSIIGIFDTIQVAACPARFPLMHVIVSLSGQKGEDFQFSSRVAGPDGKVLQQVQPVHIRIENDNARTSQINGYMGMVFPSPGEYMVEIMIDDTVVHTIPFQVVQRQQR